MYKGQIMDYNFREDYFESDFASWETLVSKYETETTSALPDNVKLANLLNRTSGALQRHLRLNATLTSTYVEVRDIIQSYYMARRSFNPLHTSSYQQPVAMAIGKVGEAKVRQVADPGMPIERRCQAARAIGCHS